MNRTSVVGAVFAVLVVTVLALLYLNFASPAARPGAKPSPHAVAPSPPAKARPAPSRAVATPTASPTSAPTPAGRQAKLVLYFQGADVGMLFPEEREVGEVRDDNTRARRVIEQLIEGPKKDLLPTIPPGTRLREVYFDAAGTTYVDFSRELVTRHVGGSSEELMTVESIVNSLARNVPEVRAVVFLVEGKPITTLAGHVDLSEPFYPNSLRLSE